MANKTAQGIILSLSALGLLAVLALFFSQEPIGKYFSPSSHFQNIPSMRNKPAFFESDSIGKATDNPVLPVQVNQGDRDLLDNERPERYAHKVSASTTPNRNRPSSITKNPISNNSFYTKTSAQNNLAKSNIQSTQVFSNSSENVDVPLSVTIPAALAQPDAQSSLDGISQKEVQAIAESFFKAVDAETQSGVSPELAWKKQQLLADEIFRACYGWEAFNAESARANQQAKGK